MTSPYCGSKRSFNFYQYEWSCGGSDVDAEDGGEEEEAERRVNRYPGRRSEINPPIWMKRYTSNINNTIHIHPNIDRWAVEKFNSAWNPTGMLEVSSFSTLFPQYREKYLQDSWPRVESALKEYGVACKLNLVEGSKTTWKLPDAVMLEADASVPKPRNSEVALTPALVSSMESRSQVGNRGVLGGEYEALTNYAIGDHHQKIEPQLLQSFIEELGILELETHNEIVHEWSKASKMLCGIDLDSGMRAVGDNFKLSKCIQTSRLYLEDDDATSGEIFINKASFLVRSLNGRLIEEHIEISSELSNDVSVFANPIQGVLTAFTVTKLQFQEGKLDGIKSMVLERESQGSHIRKKLKYETVYKRPWSMCVWDVGTRKKKKRKHIKSHHYLRSGLKSCEPKFLVSIPRRLLEIVVLKPVDYSGVSLLVIDKLDSLCTSGYLDANKWLEAHPKLELEDKLRIEEGSNDTRLWLG